jgi:hypothetical protein
MPMTIAREPVDIVVELALAIEDPAGTEELKLAQALLAFGRAINPNERLEGAKMLDQWREHLGIARALDEKAKSKQG